MFTLQPNVSPVYDNHSAAAKRNPSEEQDDLYYAAVSYSKNQEDPLYSNVGLAHPNRQQHEEEEEEDEDEAGVEYTMVNFKSSSASPEWVHEKNGQCCYRHHFMAVASLYFKSGLHEYFRVHLWVCNSFLMFVFLYSQIKMSRRLCWGFIRSVQHSHQKSMNKIWESVMFTSQGLRRCPQRH